MAEKKKKGKWRTLLVVLSLVLLLSAALVARHFYRIIFQPNVSLTGKETAYLYIPTGSDFEKVMNLVTSQGFLNDPYSFSWVARQKGYPGKIKPGKYELRNGMNNNELVNLLRSGRQVPVRVSFQSIRTVQDLAGKISRQIEADSVSLLNHLRDRDYLKEFNVQPSQVFVLFIPNTYEFVWNTSADQFIHRMSREQTKFWNGERLSKAREAGLTINEVVILASIVEKETVQDNEKPEIAGVYINRLKKEWPLQADPTLIFAWNDYSIRRVLNKHKEINSPYNTYLHTGLPPGPICLPSVASIESVLNFSHHNYMFFCAKEDLSGSHNFAVTLSEHSRNAERYQAALKRLNIH